MPAKRIPRETRPCAHCGADVTRQPSKFARAHTFCSQECSQAWRREETTFAPWPDLDNVAATGAMLWTDWEGNRQPHAVWDQRIDFPASDRNFEQTAARWLADHPDQLLDWPDPACALFGAANATRAA